MRGFGPGIAEAVTRVAVMKPMVTDGVGVVVEEAAFVISASALAGCLEQRSLTSASPNWRPSTLLWGGGREGDCHWQVGQKGCTKLQIKFS